MTVAVGKKIPAFSLPRSDGAVWKSAAARGGRLVLYFYPKDMTPGCTLEGQDFRDLHAAFQRARTTVLGISRDSCERHAKFRAREKFQFELLSDEDEKVCRLFDVIREKSLYGRKFMGIERSTFLVDDSGKLAREWRKVRVKGHAAEVLRGGQVAVSAGKRTAGVKPAPVQQRRLFVLDTNVLMHDPTAIFRFQEHDVYLPMVVLEELDANKKGLSEASRNVRQVSRFLDDLMRDATKDEIDAGLPLPSAVHAQGAGQGNGNGNGQAAAGSGKPGSAGRLFFQTRQLSSALPDYLPGHGADNAILSQTLALQALHHEARVTLVSKDINLRIKAAVVGVHAEDYYSDKTIEDADVLYTGLAALPADFWEKSGKDIKSWKEAERTYYQVTGPIVAELHVNQFVHESGDQGIEAIVRRIEAGTATLELARDFRGERHSVWGINARNREQNFALNLLMDPDIDFVTILGPAGTGKTLLTLAAGLMQTLESNRFAEIIMTRVTIPLGEDIGFLPGTEEEKMEPWMGALMDNLEVLTQTGEGGNWGRQATNDLLRNRIKIRSLNFMRGRTFLNRYVILDEAQNLTPKQMKALVTRAGPGTKIVCLGNIAQIDTPYLTETTSGLTYVVNRFRGWGHSGHITLLRGERSRLADFASDTL